MVTTIVRPRDPALRQALRLAVLFAAVKLLLHVAANLWEAHIGWGYFRDEFYYIACGRHLAWGYVDHGPLVAVQARISELLFGRSLAGLRLLSASAGAARVFLTGVLCWSLGGRRPAQAFAMLCVLLAPQYLGTDSFLSMNSFESCFWMTCLLALILIERGGSQKLWLLFGLSAGLGLLNKPSMTFFLAALLIAMMLTPQRRLLASRWTLAGVALVFVIVAPYALWQIGHGWPTWEFLENGRTTHKNIALAPAAFLMQQLLVMGPLLAFVWVAGLIHLVRRVERQWLGLTYVLFLAIMMAMHAKDYYVSPVYPILFAAGGLAWQTRFVRNSRVAKDRVFAFPLYQSVLTILAIFFLPLSIPLMTPDRWLTYTNATGLAHISTNSEKYASGPFPQFYADRFGWQEEVEQVSRIYNALPPAQRKITGILCDNYGEAGAINFLGRGLPVALSRHNNYYLWGSQGYTFDSMILIEGTSLAHLRQFFDSAQIVGHIGTPYSIPHEHKNIYLVSGRHFYPAVVWLDGKHYD